MLDRLQFWYLTHPRIGRPLLAAAVLHILFLCAVKTAPDAVASSNGALLYFTGLHDSHGVPIGDYYLSTVSFTDQIIKGGSGLSDPLGWAAGAMVSPMILDMEAGLFVGIIAVSLWLMKALVGGWWLTLIGQIAQAVSAAVIGVFTKIGLLALAIPVGVFMGVMRIKRGEHGSGWMTILAGIALPALSVTVFSDPAGLMYGKDGVLDFGRQIGFSVAQTVHPGGIYSGDGFNGKVDTLTSSLITHVVREPMQMWNFGHIVDSNPACAAGYSAAIRTGIKDAPIKAMKHCGDSQAVAYAQHMDGTNMWVGAVLIVVAMLVGYVMVACGWSVLKVLAAALWSTATVVVFLWVGAIFQRRAMDSVLKFFKHGVELMCYLIYACVVGVAIEYTVSHQLPPELGGNSVFPRVLILGVVACVAIYLLHHLHEKLTGQQHPTVRAVSRVGQVATGMAIGAALKGGVGAAIGGAKALKSRYDDRGVTPWDSDSAVEERHVLGSPTAVDAVMSRTDMDTKARNTPTAPAEVSTGRPSSRAETATVTRTETGDSGGRYVSEADHNESLIEQARQELAHMDMSRFEAASIDPTEHQTGTKDGARQLALDDGYQLPEEPPELDPAEVPDNR